MSSTSNYLILHVAYSLNFRYRIWSPKENYDVFDNTGGDTPGITPSQTPTSERRHEPSSARYEAGAEHISVELKSAGGNNNQGGSKA